MTALRVRYREGQPLRADDLTDEQAYRLGARRRHALAMHGWGIVRGLRLETTPEGLLLHPGLAIDGYGRELIVPAAVPLSWDDLFRHFASPPAAVDLWLAYARTPLAPPHGDSCGEGRHDRWREQARLRLYPTDLNSRVDSRKPPGVTPGPLDPRLAAAPPDEASAWPVYLGRVLRVQPGPDSTLSGRVLHTTRPYATLVGEAVGAPLRELTPPPEAEAAPSTQPAAPATGAAQSAASTATEQVPPPRPAPACRWAPSGSATAGASPWSCLITRVPGRSVSPSAAPAI